MMDNELPKISEFLKKEGIEVCSLSLAARFRPLFSLH
jgi:hypothetical protein